MLARIATIPFVVVVLAIYAVMLALVGAGTFIYVVVWTLMGAVRWALDTSPRR